MDLSLGSIDGAKVVLPVRTMIEDFGEVFETEGRCVVFGKRAGFRGLAEDIVVGKDSLDLIACEVAIFVSFSALFRRCLHDDGVMTKNDDAGVKVIGFDRAGRRSHGR